MLGGDNCTIVASKQIKCFSAHAGMFVWKAYVTNSVMDTTAVTLKQGYSVELMKVKLT